MDHATILSGLTGLFRDIFGDETLTPTSETSAVDIAGRDSMNHITIVVEVERRFGVKFQTGEIEELKTVGDFTALIAKKAR
jgi:acyl carrier protein